MAPVMGDLDDPAIDDRHVAARQIGARTAELQGTGETGKAAADDDDVIHGDGLRVNDLAV
jgi:hypothetical protein